MSDLRGRGRARALALWRRHWTTLAWLVLAVWTFPRLWPHVEALVDRRVADRDRPSFAVRTLDGAALDTDSLRGRVVLVNVWATWCLPCRVEMPLLENTWQRHRAAGLIVLGASVDRAGDDVVRTYVRERGVSYPVAVVDDPVIASLGGVRGYPTSILLGRDGRVRHRVMGPIGPLSLEPAIRRALAEREGGATSDR